jgi:hypothetical protein
MLCTEWSLIDRESHYNPCSDFIAIFRQLEKISLLVRDRDTTIELTAREHEKFSNDLTREFSSALRLKHGQKHLGAYGTHVQQCFRLAALLVVNNIIQDFHDNSVSRSAWTPLIPPFIIRISEKLKVDPSTAGGRLLGMLMLAIGKDCLSAPEKMVYLAQAMKVSLTISGTLWRQTRELLLETIASENALQRPWVSYWDSVAMKRKILAMYN